MHRLYMSRKAEDNKYLHKDFHIALDNALEYIGKNFGDNAIREYLVDYAQSYFTEKTLPEIHQYILSIYSAEDALENVSLTLCENSLKVTVKKCPAIDFMRSVGHIPSQWYRETTITLYEELAKMSGLKFSLHFYNDDTGAASYTFDRGEEK